MDGRMSYDPEQDSYDDDQPVRESNPRKQVLLVLLIFGGVLGLVFIMAVVGLVTLVIPKGHEAKDRVHCMNNLRLIGALLARRQSAGELRQFNGPAFLLQVAEDIEDEDLGIFICPGEPEEAASGRPPVGSAEFIRMYRDLEPSDLAEDRDWSRYTSYAGPNWESFPEPKAGPSGTRRDRMTRLWACDACVGGRPHHEGIVVLYSSGKIDFLLPEQLEGMSEGEFQVGPGSPDPRLERVIHRSGR
jgi:hypothetical protein